MAEKRKSYLPKNDPLVLKDSKKKKKKKPTATKKKKQGLVKKTLSAIEKRKKLLDSL